MPWAIAIPAIIAAGSAAYGAKSASQASKDAAAANARNAGIYNKLEERLFHEGRGFQGHAFLPEYGGDFERQLFADTANSYAAAQKFYGTPDAQLAQAQAIRDRYQPAFEQGSNLIDTIYSGEMQQQRLAEAQPVQAARTAYAKTQKQGILEDIQARLGALDAASARKGYVGAGTGYQNAAIRQTAPLYQQAAGVGALANLQNAQEVQGIADTNRQLQLSSLNLPGQRAGQALALQQLPVSTLNQQTANSQVPFGFFKIPIGQQSAVQLPTVQPIPGGGQIAAAGVSQLASAYGNYAANQQLASQMNAYNNPGIDNSYLYQQPQQYQVGQYDLSPVPMWGGGYG